jgi:hypothetical protein
MTQIIGFKVMEGGGAVLDRAEQLSDAIKSACYENAEGLPLALVLGVLEIVKAEILEEHRE